MNEKPSDDTLRHQLEIQWQDHFKTRDQTWKSLQIGLVMFIAIIGADIKLSNPWLLIPMGCVLVISILFGISITIHHRKVQIRKFQFINMLEEKLSLHIPGYMDNVVKPSEFKWRNIANFKKITTPTFILIMHLLLLVFAIGYIILRISEMVLL